MDDKNLLALMYDFYNENRLKGQNDDIKYYIDQIRKYNLKKVLVVGAGTGRIAIPLSEYGEVTALDFDSARLNLLLKKKPTINIINIDFLASNLNNNYDLIILPYSTIQFDNDEKKLNLFLNKIVKTMNGSTRVIFDVSESFNNKKNERKKLLFKNYCEEIADDVEVFYSSKRHEKCIEFFIEYKLCNHNKSVIEHEKYYYYDEELFKQLILKNGLSLLKIDHGYGNYGFLHKHLYHCKKEVVN